MISKVSVFISGALLLAERGYLPDALLRSGIRRLCRNRLAEIEFEDKSAGEKRIASFVDAMNHADIAPIPHKANQQHYELPANFFELVLGMHRKYSCGYWDEDDRSLDQSEQRALESTCEHADIRNGDRILELGCGWGSLTLWMAQQFPGSHITAISNSVSQREHILSSAAERGLENLDVLTRDINHFDTDCKFDRIVSIEMFEAVGKEYWSQFFEKIKNSLIDSGLAKELRDKPFDPDAGTGVTDFAPPPVLTDSTIPSAPTGLSAAGAFTKTVKNSIVEFSELSHTSHFIVVCPTGKLRGPDKPPFQYS